MKLEQWAHWAEIGASVAIFVLLFVSEAGAQARDVDSGRGAARGALIGFGAFLVGGFACLAVCPEEPGGGANMAPAGGLILGVVLGLPVGALIGASVAPERWQPLPLDASRPADAAGFHGTRETAASWP